MMIKPDCYKCKHRRSISNCRHPKLGDTNNDPMAQVLAIFASVDRVPPMQAGIEALGIKANYHGIRNGWFNFPFNYDPHWLEECNGFEEVDNAKTN